jgi:hypothetical protein
MTTKIFHLVNRMIRNNAEFCSDSKFVQTLLECICSKKEHFQIPELKLQFLKTSINFRLNTIKFDKLKIQSKVGLQIKTLIFLSPRNRFFPKCVTVCFRERTETEPANGQPGLTVHRTDCLLQELERLNFVPPYIVQKLFKSC